MLRDSLDTSPPKSRKPGMNAMASPSTKGRQAGPDSAFDLWLQRGLQQVFNDVAQEPIPAEILALIEQSRKP